LSPWSRWSAPASNRHREPLSSLPLVHIHYLRPPGRTEIFRQHLLLDRDAVKVTLATNLSFEPPIRIGERIALETGSSAVWFTFPGAWHDIGLFHLADGTPTGTYSNILTPPEMEADGTWRTTDLFLDLWIDGNGSLSVLDRDQFDEAVAARWVDERTAQAALSEVERLRAAFDEGTWPPPVVAEWPLGRAVAVMQGDRA